MRNQIDLAGRALLALCALLGAAASIRAEGDTAPDAARALLVGCGGAAASAVDIALCDVQPGPGANLLDAVRLARRASGLDPWPSEFSFSFEDGLQGWYPRGTDLDDPPVEWSITPSQDRATDGASSAKLFLNNLNDAGKIWLERPFRLRPDTTYTVRLRYDFASAAWGDMNLWSIITGAHAKPPQTRDDLVYQGDTGNGSPTDVGFVWMDKSYTLEAATGGDGLLFICIGIWGTWESPGTYYVDDVHVAFTAKE